MIIRIDHLNLSLILMTILMQILKVKNTFMKHLDLLRESSWVV